MKIFFRALVGTIDWYTHVTCFAQKRVPTSINKPWLNVVNFEMYRHVTLFVQNAVPATSKEKIKCKNKPWLNAKISVTFNSTSLLGPLALVGTWINFFFNLSFFSNLYFQNLYHLANSCIVAISNCFMWFLYCMILIYLSILVLYP